jgi:DNA mismatch endonuclease (patch repair protein)
MSANKDKDTKPEILLRKALWNEGLRGYRLHWKKVPGRPDIAFTSKKTAIFVNGCFWHRCPYCNLSLPKSHTDFWKKKFEKNIQRDKQKVELLEISGWEVMTIWECQILDDVTVCVNKIKNRIC